ncbi:hypothetical protein G9A89_018443 [Geosiphon pyriformis]|nr:hypothetical protein G9A89_018443 [Geosiphon pyriformis]
MPGSTINIVSADAFTNTKMPLVKIVFQSKQKKNKLLPDFGTVSPWKITESEEEEDKDQEFNYQNPILEDQNIQTQQHLENSEIETPNIRTSPNQRNQNPELIHQQNLSPVIVVDQPPIKLIGEPIQPPPVLPQQPLLLQQPLQQPSQPPNLDPIAYTPIAKLDNFTSKEDDA